MNKHKDFILTSITSVLEEAVVALSSVGGGIETYPLNNYFMESIFIRMTGFQEQKLKCIVWEMATNDYDFRRKLLDGNLKLGECSAYDDKQKIYKSLKEKVMIKCQLDYETLKQNIQNETVDSIKKIFGGTNLEIWNPRHFNEFEKKGKEIIKNTQFFNSENNLLESKLQNNYKDLYEHRNRIAHNATSYQSNLPTLDTLRKDKDGKSHNYIIWFSILILIDNIFMELYEKYLDLVEREIY